MNMIKVKLNDLNARLPQRNTPTDAGLDVFACESMAIPAKEWRAVGTGVHISVPQGYYARIAPRSGLAVKYGIDVFAGVVDSGYRGEVKVILMNASDKVFKVDVGDKIAQLIIQPCESWTPIEVATLDDLGDSERGVNGFGSSDQPKN